MIKQVVLLKKRDDLTVSAFREYYENHHRLIGEKYLNPHVTRYVRRYLETPPEMDEAAMPYHVVTEMWFATTKDRDACYKGLSAPDAQREILADEAKMFAPGGKFSTLLLEVDSNVESNAV